MGLWLVLNLGNSGLKDVNALTVLGLIASVVVLLLLLLIARDINNARAQRLLVFKMVPCPICGGGGKLPDRVHDSDDIQFVNCGRCAGSGKILMI